MWKSESYELDLLMVCMLSMLGSMLKLGGPEGLGEILKLYSNVHIKECKGNLLPYIIIYKSCETLGRYAFL